MLDSMVFTPALIGNGRTDLLAQSPLGGALMSEMIDSATSSPPNFARFIFFEPVARRFYPEWEAVAAMKSRNCVPRPAAKPLSSLRETGSRRIPQT